MTENEAETSIDGQDTIEKLNPILGKAFVMN